MIRILHLSDPHFGAADPKVAEAFLRIAPSFSPDHTILSGDLTMRARTREYDDSRRFTAALPRPLFVIPGNHDIPAANQPFDRFFSPFRRHCASYGENLEPEFIGGNLHIASTNSVRAFGFHADWSDGFLSPEQLARMEKQFLARSGLPRILVLHHPLLAPDGHERAVVHPLPGLLESIARASVDLVLCGHFHVSRIATAGLLGGWNCIVSQAPTVCSTRLQGEPQGFHEIRLEESRVEVILHQYQEGDFVPGPPVVFTKNGASGWESSSGEALALA